MKRRLAAGIVDVAVLSAVYVLVLMVGLSIGANAEVALLGVAWVILVAPLYFALYHAFGTGATPGQLELRIGIRDEETGGLIPLGRALARAYEGPLNVFLLLTGSERPQRSLLDRLTRSTSVTIALHGKAPELAAPTASELVAMFESAEPRDHLRRSRALLKARPTLLYRSVAAVYAGLLVIVALLAGLLFADASAADVEGSVVALALISLGTVLFASGVYWTQAVIVEAVELVRVGQQDAGVGEVLRRSLRRVNALAFPLLLIVAPFSLGGFRPESLAPLALVLVYPALRVSLVVPALVLEDTRVLGAFARSWQLTRSHGPLMFGLLMKSGGYFLLAQWGASLFAGIAFGFITEDVSVGGAILVTIVALALGSIPVVYYLTRVGVAWALLYEDLRRTLPPGTRR